MDAVYTDHGQCGCSRYRLAFSMTSRIIQSWNTMIEVEMLKSPYELLGGEQTVRDLVNRFYDLMDTLPEAAGIRDLHQADLSGAREKLFKFLSGWLGGPQLYMQEYGHPRLRARHLPFPIDVAERDQWMMCMDRAMDDIGVEQPLRQQLHDAFFRTADFMRNQ